MTLFVNPGRPGILHDSRPRGGDTVRPFLMVLPALTPPSLLEIRGGGEGYLEFLGLVINFWLDRRWLK